MASKGDLQASIDIINDNNIILASTATAVAELQTHFKDKETSYFAIFICVFMAIFLFILVLYIIYHTRIIRGLFGISKTAGPEQPPDLKKLDNYKKINMAGKSLVVIGAYVAIMYYALNGLHFLEIMLLFPCILFITLPVILRYFLQIDTYVIPAFIKRVGIQQIPTEHPVATFIFFLVTINLWYTCSSNIDEELFSKDAKALNINISVVLIFLYILFKHYYKLEWYDALLRACGLTVVSAIFMISAPMYAHIPIAR